MLRPNDIVHYTAQGYSNSETVGSVGDYTLFVPQLIVGEQAQVRIDHVKRNVAYGTPVQLTKPSDKRVQPLCKHFGQCGGCTLAHMSYDEQLLFKRNKVAQNLAKLGGIDIDLPNCEPSPQQWGYRNKLSLPVRGTVGNVEVGMFRRNSHIVVPAHACLLCGDWAATLVALFTDYCNECGLAPYNEADFSGIVRHLVARYVDGQLLVTVVSNGPFNADLRPLADKLRQHFDKFGLFVNVNTLRNNVILGKTTRHICGLQYIEGKHLGVTFRLRPNSFFQVNDGVKDIIYRQVQQLADLSQTQLLVDCFSGIGVLTNVLADIRYDTFAIEIEPSAVQDANEMAQLNGTPRLTNICGDVTEHLPKLVAQHADKRMTVVLDPPRKGLNDTLCRTLKAAAPQTVVYISCDSATLARDLHALSDVYDVTFCRAYDMFPQTDQVETLVRLTRRA